MVQNGTDKERESEPTGIGNTKLQNILYSILCVQGPGSLTTQYSYVLPHACLTPLS
jgi:hypothetical protein